jgi:hypothetical protein
MKELKFLIKDERASTVLATVKDKVQGVHGPPHQRNQPLLFKKPGNRKDILITGNDAKFVKLSCDRGAFRV